MKVEFHASQNRAHVEEDKTRDFQERGRHRTDPVLSAWTLQQMVYIRSAQQAHLNRLDRSFSFVDCYNHSAGTREQDALENLRVDIGPRPLVPRNLLVKQPRRNNVQLGWKAADLPTRST